MNQSKVLKVITAASLAAALSVALTACDNESSSTAPDPATQGEDSSSSVKDKSSSSKEKIENSSSSEETNASSSSEAIFSQESSSSTVKPYKPTEFNAECQSASNEFYETNADTKKFAVATRTVGDDDFETITVDDIIVTCGAVFETPDIVESGDTLYVNSEISYPHGMANCICPTRVSFKVEDTPQFSKAKALVFNNEYTFKLETTSSPTFTVSDIGGVCLDNDSYDPEVDGAVPPVAYMKVGSDSATIVLERVQASCEFINGFTGPLELPITSSIEIRAVDDTLYLETKAKETSLSDTKKYCTCPSRLSFKVKADPSIANAKVIVMDDNLNMGNKLRIIMAEEKTNTDPSDPLKEYGLSRGTCMDKAASEKKTVDGLPQADLTVYENGRAILQMNFVEDYCEITAKVSQKVVDDTLFLDYYDITSASKCTCTIYNHTFDVKLENTGARYVKFKDEVFYLVPITYTKIPNWDL